jgi:glycosyltransferase involved in cell wall biosynthesis
MCPGRFAIGWRKWLAELKQIPRKSEGPAYPIFYPRYTSPPKQIFHGTWGFFAYFFLAKQLHHLHKEYQFDLIHAHYAAPCGVIALLAQRWMRVPIVLSIHGSDVTYTAKQHYLSSAIVRRVFQKSDAILANSVWTERCIKAYGGDMHKIHLVYYGANPPVRQMQPQPCRKDGPIALLSVGYLETRKGHAYVLHAVQQLIQQGYNLRYVIVGDGTQLAYLQSLVCKLNLTTVVSFEGYKPHQEVWSYFTDCDIFVLPSWDEAFGVVYIEALSMGKPVVGCEGQGGPEDLKRLGDCIELVKPRDVTSLVQALQRLMDNPERRQHMGRIGQQIVAENFTWERNAITTAKLYQQVLEQYEV